MWLLLFISLLIDFFLIPYFEEISGRLSVDKEDNKEKRLCRVFEHLDNVKGKRVNILEELELHTDVFNPTEQAIITDFVFGMQRLGQQKQLKGID